MPSDTARQSDAAPRVFVAPTMTEVGSVPEGRVLDFLTRKAVRDTPEEYVRQNLEKALVRQYRYDPSDCQPEDATLRHYVLAYLNSPTGQVLMRRGRSGSVIDHVTERAVAETSVPLSRFPTRGTCCREVMLLHSRHRARSRAEPNTPAPVGHLASGRSRLPEE